jgi:hypothetical protein
MDDNINLHVNPDSILVITREGLLKRLKCPFRVVLNESINVLETDVEYNVQAVYLSNENVMLYVIRGNCYYYFYFIILG